MEFFYGCFALKQQPLLPLSYFLIAEQRRRKREFNTCNNIKCNEYTCTHYTHFVFIQIHTHILNGKIEYNFDASRAFCFLIYFSFIAFSLDLFDFQNCFFFVWKSFSFFSACQMVYSSLWFTIKNLPWKSSNFRKATSHHQLKFCCCWWCNQQCKGKKFLLAHLHCWMLFPLSLGTNLLLFKRNLITKYVDIRRKFELRKNSHHSNGNFVDSSNFVAFD